MTDRLKSSNSKIGDDRGSIEAPLVIKRQRLLRNDKRRAMFFSAHFVFKCTGSDGQGLHSKSKRYLESRVMISTPTYLASSAMVPNVFACTFHHDFGLRILLVILLDFTPSSTPSQHHQAPVHLQNPKRGWGRGRRDQQQHLHQHHVLWSNASEAWGILPLACVFQNL